MCDGSATNRGVWKEFGVSGLAGQAVSSIRHPLADVDGFHRDQDRISSFWTMLIYSSA